MGPAPARTGAGFLFFLARTAAALLLLALLMCWDGIAQRPLSAAAGTLLVLFLLFARRRPRAPAAAGLLALWLLASLSPVEITLRDLPGPPRVVPLVSGSARELLERERRGEIVRGSFRRSGLEPRWVLVW